jgi:hypothetical protein
LLHVFKMGMVFSSCIYIGGTGFEFMLGRQAFYYLSHTSSPFALVILETKYCFLPIILLF